MLIYCFLGVYTPLAFSSVHASLFDQHKQWALTHPTPWPLPINHHAHMGGGWYPMFGIHLPRLGPEHRLDGGSVVCGVLLESGTVGGRGGGTHGTPAGP